jgi:hypothetical protein
MSSDEVPCILGWAISRLSVFSHLLLWNETIFPSGLLRTHVLLGDYHQALQTVEFLDMDPKVVAFQIFSEKYFYFGKGAAQHCALMSGYFALLCRLLPHGQFLQFICFHQINFDNKR